MARLLGVVLVAVVLGFTACGGGGGESTVSKASGTASTGASGATAGGPVGPMKRKGAKDRKPPVLAPKRGAPAFHGEERDAYLKARAECASEGIRGISRKYGVGARNPVLVARAYSARAYDPEIQQAGFQGCVAGFRG